MHIVVHDRIQRDVAVHTKQGTHDRRVPANPFINAFIRVDPGNRSGDQPARRSRQHKGRDFDQAGAKQGVPETVPGRLMHEQPVKWFQVDQHLGKREADQTEMSTTDGLESQAGAEVIGRQGQSANQTYS